MEVKTTGSSASQCASEGSQITDRVKLALIDKLGGKGVVRVSMFQVNQIPTQEQYGYRPPPRYQTRQEFQAHATVTVETRNLDQLGPLIADGINGGADQLDSVRFTLRNDSEARQHAIAKAAEDAKTKADVVARSMGVQLGDVLKISTNASVQPQVVYGRHYASLGASQSAAPEMPVKPRNVGFSATVNATYAIR